MASHRICSLLAALLFVAASATAQCIDESGSPVPWFVAVKLPKSPEDTPYIPGNTVLQKGLAFAYFTSKNAQFGFKLSKKAVGDPQSLIGRTLAPIYSKKDNLTSARLLYNDELPSGSVSFTDGHTKGVVHFNSARGAGFWLVHSVPKFPPDPNQPGAKYGYPHTGQMYGQSFLCISLDAESSADVIGQQLMYNHPYLYGEFLSPEFIQKYPHLALAAQKKHINAPPYSHVAHLASLHSKDSFISFAKYTKFGRDLYADLVAPSLRVGLLVETWPNGPGKMPSRCGTAYPVENVDAMAYGLGYNVTFSTRHDHAKWAVSDDGKKPVVCIGDINRMNTQLKRGGGTVCFINKAAWKAFYGAVKAIEACPKNK